MQKTARILPAKLILRYSLILQEELLNSSIMASYGYIIKNTVEKALELLTVKPDIEYGSVVINGKTIYVMKVFRINEGTSLLSDEL